MGIMTPLAKVKSLGSASNGTDHFVKQRISAVFMLPLAFWFVISVINLMHSSTDLIPLFIASPVNIIASILFIGMFLYHGFLGLQVVIEDYISNKVAHIIAILLLKAVCIVSFVSGVVAIFSLHMMFRMYG